MTDTPKTKQQLLSQWNTPGWVAEAMWQRARLRSPTSLLEPAAGTGQLILPVDDNVAVTACEIDPELAATYLAQFDPPLHALRVGDFLAQSFDPPPAGSWRFDVALLNPPFENNQDVAFVTRALEWSAVVVALVRVQFLHRQYTQKHLWSRPDVCLSYRGDCVPRPRFGGTYNPMDEYCILELTHGPQQRRIEYARVLRDRAAE